MYYADQRINYRPNHQFSQLNGSIEDELYGLNAGLNRRKGGLLKKIKLKSIVKGVGKVVKFAAPIATSFVPGGGAATKVLGKLGKVGRIAKKVGGSRAFKTVKNVRNQVRANRIPVMPIAAAGFGAMPVVPLVNNTQVNQLPAEITNYGSADANEQAPQVQQNGTIIPTTQVSNQNQSIQDNATGFQDSFSARTPATIPVKLSENQEEAQESAKSEASALLTTTKNNTLLYVGLGVAGLAAVYFITKNKNKNE